MTWWSRGHRSVTGVIMTSISVCQQELSEVAVELWSCHSLPRVWVILTLLCPPEHRGAVVCPVEHIWVTANKVLSFKSCLCLGSFFLQCLIVKPHWSDKWWELSTVLKWLCHLWFECRAAELRCWGEKKKKIQGNSPPWRVCVEDWEVTRAACHCGGGEEGWSWLALVSLWKSEGLANAAVIQCSLNACW